MWKLKAQIKQAGSLILHVIMLPLLLIGVFAMERMYRKIDPDILF